jgi:hypothetical protein
MLHLAVKSGIVAAALATSAVSISAPAIAYVYRSGGHAFAGRWRGDVVWNYGYGYPFDYGAYLTSPTDSWGETTLPATPMPLE